jgi:multidrug resistance efflux pump/GAF domain-containing protein
MVGDVANAVVLLGKADEGPFLPSATWPELRPNIKHLTEVAERVLKERCGVVLKRTPSQRSPESSSIERFEIAYPVQVDGRLYGALALDISGRPETELQAAMRQIQWGIAWLEVLIRRESALKEAAVRGRLQTVLELVGHILEHDRFYACQMAFVTELATRLKCDRVSIGFVRGGHVRLGALSHTAQFKKETNLIRAIEAAMQEAVDQQVSIRYPVPPETTPQISRSHTELAGQHGLGAHCTVPMMGREKTLGAITLERPAERPFDSEAVALCEAVSALAGPLLEIKQQDDRWLAAKGIDVARRWIGYMIGPGHIALKLTIAVIAGMIVFLTFAKGDYRVTAKTVMEPEVKRAMVAPFNGYLTEAPLKAGNLVSQDQVMAVLDDRDLKLEHLKWLSQQEQFIKQYHQALAERQASQANILNSQIDQARAQLALLDEQLSRTRVRAPFNGVIVTGDLSQELGAPVEKGKVLFEVAPLDAYRVILQVDEHDVADIAENQQGDLVLASIPGETKRFKIVNITPVSVAQEGQNYFRVEARLLGGTDRIRPGMEGVGKVEIDRRKLAWIWSHQLIDWVRLKVWSWVP